MHTDSFVSRALMEGSLSARAPELTSPPVIWAAHSPSLSAPSSARELEEERQEEEQKRREREREMARLQEKEREKERAKETQKDKPKSSPLPPPPPTAPTSSIPASSPPTYAFKSLLPPHQPGLILAPRAAHAAAPARAPQSLPIRPEKRTVTVEDADEEEEEDVDEPKSPKKSVKFAAHLTQVKLLDPSPAPPLQQQQQKQAQVQRGSAFRATTVGGVGIASRGYGPVQSRGKPTSSSSSIGPVSKRAAVPSSLPSSSSSTLATTKPASTQPPKPILKSTSSVTSQPAATGPPRYGDRYSVVWPAAHREAEEEVEQLLRDLNFGGTSRK